MPEYLCLLPLALYIQVELKTFFDNIDYHLQDVRKFLLGPKYLNVGPRTLAPVVFLIRLYTIK